MFPPILCNQHGSQGISLLLTIAGIAVMLVVGAGFYAILGRYRDIAWKVLLSIAGVCLLALVVMVNTVPTTSESFGDDPIDFVYVGVGVIGGLCLIVGGGISFWDDQKKGRFC